MAVEIKGKTTKELAEKRAKLVSDARALLEQHEDDWTDDRQAQYDAMIEDSSAVKAALDRRQALTKIEENANQEREQFKDDPRETPGRKQTDHDQPRMITVRNGRHGDGRPRYEEVECGPRGAAEYSDSFRSYLKSGRGKVGVLHQEVGVQNGVSRYAALQSDDAEQAGYLVASEQFAAGLLKEVDDLLFIRRYARIHTVSEASSLGIRKRTARMSTFNWSAELQVSTADSALKYGKKILTPHHATGKILVSRDLVRRSVASIEGEVRMEMARDGGELMEDGYLTGTGNQQPLGVFTASSDGISTSRDVQTGSSTNFTSDGLIDAKFALKGQYRRGQRGEVRWLFHRDAIKNVSKLQDSEGQYLFRVGAGVAQDGGPPEDILLGFPVDESERAPNTFTTGQYVGLLANWRYYEIADALDIEIQVLNELHADTNQIGYIGRLKTDGLPTLEEAFVRLITD